jgi:hypothetical protein
VVRVLTSVRRIITFQSSCSAWFAGFECVSPHNHLPSPSVPHSLAGKRMLRGGQQCFCRCWSSATRSFGCIRRENDVNLIYYRRMASEWSPAIASHFRSIMSDDQHDCCFSECTSAVLDAVAQCLFQLQRAVTIVARCGASSIF